MHLVTSTDRPRFLIPLAFSALVFLVLLSIPHASGESKRFGITPKPTISPTPTPIDPSGKLTIEEARDIFLGGSDFDCDGIPNAKDNCPLTYNPDQKDSDNDGIGDACDGGSASTYRVDKRCDADSDGVIDSKDNCPSICNPNQKDSNHNGIGDVCENLPDISTTMRPCSKTKPPKKAARRPPRN
jgi:hypothetical protein